MTTVALNDEQERALQIMREIVEEKGADYVYPDSEKEHGDTCQYLTYDEDHKPTGPSCLVGHYLVRTGVSFEDLVQYEGSNINDSFGLGLPSWLSDALSAAQARQDGGEPWGVALAAFESKLNHR